MSPSLGYRVSPMWSVGAGLNLMYTFFGIQTAINTPVGPGDGELKLHDNQLGLGGQLSFLFEPSHCTRFGLVYNSAMKLNFNAVPAFSNLGVLRPVLESHGLLDADLALHMTVPQTLMLSLFHDLNPRWAVLSSVGWQNWSQFGRVGVELDSVNSRSLTVNRNYKDTWHGSVGFQYKTPYAWRLSSGIAYDSSMVDEKNLTPDMPVSKTWRFGFGAQYPLSCRSSLNFAYTLDWIGDMPINSQGGPLTGNLQGVYRNTALHFFGISYPKVL